MQTGLSLQQLPWGAPRSGHRDSIRPVPVVAATEPGDSIRFSGRVRDNLRLRHALRQLERKNPAVIKHAAIPVPEWLAQFDTADEKLLAIRLLENLR